MACPSHPIPSKWIIFTKEPEILLTQIAPLVIQNLRWLLSIIHQLPPLCPPLPPSPLYPPSPQRCWLKMHESWLGPPPSTQVGSFHLQMILIVNIFPLAKSFQYITDTFTYFLIPLFIYFFACQIGVWLFDICFNGGIIWIMGDPEKYTEVQQFFFPRIVHALCRDSTFPELASWWAMQSRDIICR